MRQMSNRRRGEVTALIGGEPRRLRLTLGALAELESALGSGDLAQLGQRLARGALSARDLQVILAAGLRGAGETISDAEAAALPVAGELPAMAAAAVELLALTFGEAGAEDEMKTGARAAGDDGASAEAGAGGPFPARRRRFWRRARSGPFRGMRSWLLASGVWALRRRFSGR